HDVLPRQGRYLAPLLPLMFCALASAVWRIAPLAARLFERWGVSARARSVIGLVVLLAMVVLPLIPLQRYYADGVESGQTNERFFEALAQIEASRRNDELVLLDRQL